MEYYGFSRKNKNVHTLLRPRWSIPCSTQNQMKKKLPSILLLNPSINDLLKWLIVYSSCRFNRIKIYYIVMQIVEKWWNSIPFAVCAVFFSYEAAKKWRFDCVTETIPNKCTNLYWHCHRTFSFAAVNCHSSAICSVQREVGSTAVCSLPIQMCNTWSELLFFFCSSFFNSWWRRNWKWKKNNIR